MRGFVSEGPACRIRPEVGSGSNKFHLSTLRKTSSATATLSQFCSMKGFQSVGYFYLEHNLFFCWESRNIEQWKRLTWDSTLWLANKLNHFYEIIFIGSKPFIINHSHGIYDFWTCIRWQLKSRRTQVEVIFLENTTIFGCHRLKQCSVSAGIWPL